jgi:protocatechuate 3,4-dioxygenase beta subunit
MFLAAAVAAFACGATPLQAQSPQAATNATVFKGTITGEDGKPVAGATVEYWEYGESLANPYLPGASAVKKQSVTSGGDGTFALPISSSSGIVLTKKTGLAPAWKLLNRTPNAVQEPEGKLEMRTPGTLEGLVVDGSDKPVAGAEAYVALALDDESQNGLIWNALAGKQARDLFSARTDSAGRFRIENFPSNAVAILAAEAPGKISRPSEEAAQDLESGGYRVGQPDIKLVLEPAGSVEGQITVSDNNRTIPGADLMLLPDALHGLTVGKPPEKAGTNGMFRFDRVLPGSYTILASFGEKNSGWVAEPVPVTVKTGETVRGVQLKAVRGTLLEVTVLSQGDRKPQSGVKVSAIREEYPFHGTTDSNGVARVYLMPGDYQVSAFRPPLSSGQGSTTVEAGTTNRAEIELSENPAAQLVSEPPRKISGVVQMPDGKPAARASVHLISPGQSGKNLKTDANGKFELKWNPRQFGGSSELTTCVLARDADNNLAVVQDVEEDATNLVLRLAPGLTLASRVESNGKPVTNATAQLVFWTGRSGMWLRGLSRTKTPGLVEIPALPPGRKYGLIVSAPGYGQRQSHSMEISADPGRQELDKVELKPANLPLAGQVLDQDDKPVARCYVNISGDNQPSANARTDREGRFQFARVCEGTIRLSANSQRSYGSTSVEGGDTNVVLRLGQVMGSSDSKPHKLKGVVTDAEGKPLQGVQVAVFPNNGVSWVKTGTNGEYSLTWSLQSWQMRSGGPMLVLRDKVRNLAATYEVPEEATNLNAKLKPALVLAGQVKNAEGSPMPTAQVGFWLKAGNSYQHLENQPVVPVNAEGRFEIKCLPPEADYIVYASAKGYGKRQQQLEPEYESNRLELDAFVLTPADSVIAGQVVNDEDKPVSGVNVNLNGDGQPDGNVTTDSNGRFQFKVCKGEIRLYAYPQNGGANAQATVEAGDTNIVMTLISYSGGARPAAPKRASLTGKSLPDLATVNLASDVAPSGEPVLLCLFDAGQRPSRHIIKQLEQQAAALKSQKVCVLGIQAVVTGDEGFNEWKSASPVSFPVGRVTESSDKVKWASAVSAFPWFILTDASHRVVSEGFEFSELEAEVKKLTK